MKPVDVLILGAGPAGLSAGIYSARAGAKTAIVENLVCGGQINMTPMISDSTPISIGSISDMNDSIILLELCSYISLSFPITCGVAPERIPLLKIPL